VGAGLRDPLAEGDTTTFEARDAFGQVTRTGSRADLVFGSNSELRAVAEVYAADDARRSSSTTSSRPGPR
jgi:catalase-peroxidase